MAKARLKPSPQNAAERNLALVQEIMNYILQNPQVLDSLPENFELVILPHDDPDLRQYNLDLLDKYGSESKPVVLASTSKSEYGDAAKEDTVVLGCATDG